MYICMDACIHVKNYLCVYKPIEMLLLLSSTEIYSTFIRHDGMLMSVTSAMILKVDPIVEGDVAVGAVHVLKPVWTGSNRLLRFRFFLFFFIFRLSLFPAAVFFGRKFFRGGKSGNNISHYST